MNILLSILISLLFFINYKKLAKILKLYDYPDKNLKKHSLVTAPIGGIIIYVVFITIILFDIFFSNLKIDFFSNYSEQLYFWIFITIFTFFGIIDDKIKLNSNLKVIFFLIFFLIFSFVSHDGLLRYIYFNENINNYNLGKFSIPFTVFCYISFTQAFNMYDGLDKQAGLFSAFCLIIFFIFSKYNIFILYVLIPLTLFIFFNKKGKIFLGNSGSNFISFFLGYVSINLSQKYEIPSENFIILFAVIGFELIRLFFVRVKNKKNPLKGDLNHIHHLSLNKFSYINALLFIFALTAFPTLGLFLNINSILLIFFQLISYVCFINYVKSK